MINVLYKAIVAPLGVFSRNNVKGRLQASSVTVVFTALFGSVIAPVAYFYTYKDSYEINLDISRMLIGLVISITTWLVVCTMFWLLSKTFNKKNQVRTDSIDMGAELYP